MNKNPFSPSFSIRPERFYGRKKELDLIKEALSNPDSANRFLFVTGTRGCGKTSLLHQFALTAKRMKWTVYETTYQDATEALRSYAGLTTTTTTEASLNPSVSIAGIGASAGSLSKKTTKTQSKHLAKALCEKLAKTKRTKGLFITIDEIQKIPEEDMEEISHAVQAAKTQGLPIALVIAGLPVAYGKIRRYKGCTFVQRMRRYKLGMLNAEETLGFLSTMFELVPEIKLDDTQVNELGKFSAGHPYLLQLAGSYTYDVAKEKAANEPITLTSSNIREAEKRAFADYRENILNNLLSGIRNGTKDYLKAICDVSDENSVAATAEVAAKLGKTLQECSTVRARTIDLQLVNPIERSKLQLALPYMPFAFNEDDAQDTQDTSSMLAPRKTPF